MTLEKVIEFIDEWFGVFGILILVAVWFPCQLIADLMTIVKIRQSNCFILLSDNLTQKQLDWCLGNQIHITYFDTPHFLQDKNKQRMKTFVKFEDDADAMAFKLAWS